MALNDPRLRDAFNLHQAGDLTKAARLYGEVLHSDPHNFDANYLLGFLQLQRGEFQAGERSIAAALDVNPNSLDALFNRGRALQQLGRDQEALACFDKALTINPNIPDVLFSRANSLTRLRRDKEALADLDRVVALKPELADAWNNRANALAALSRLEDAVSNYDKALSLKPSDMRTLNHRAITLFELKRYEDAARDFEALLKAVPDFEYAQGNLVYSKLHSCDWGGLDEARAELSAALRAGRQVLTPIQATAVSHSVEAQLRCSRLWAARQYPRAAEALWRGEVYHHDRIRLAYLSADFHSHATTALMAGVFDAHDKTRFETFAISYGRDDQSEMRRRLAGAFERFIDVREKNDLDTARLLRQWEVDLAIDLKGYTQESRPGILAHRPAPVQAHYLGFPSTLGADYIDYLLADKIVIPDEHTRYYSEKIAYLPDTYQCNDSNRRSAEKTSARADEGLPQTGFVFCSFNNNFKITPEVFAIWLQLLKRVEGSVLWLLQDNDSAVRNLKREADSEGVPAQRLIFAQRKNLDEHLARHRLADLFLDTLPYNAHTTASDALWMGVPVLTCLGTTFAGRVAASLLRAIGLPEMITASLKDYEALALKLAGDPAALAAVKARLAQNRDTYPLFDTLKFTRRLESAYTTMWQRASRGKAPESFAVDANSP